MDTNENNASGQCGYVCFYNRDRAEIRAASLLDAKQKAVAHFRVPPKKAHMVSVMLAERADGSSVSHIATE